MRDGINYLNQKIYFGLLNDTLTDEQTKELLEQKVKLEDELKMLDLIV